MLLSKYTVRNIIKKEISSIHMQEKRSLRIALPPGYNELISYPIIYTLDGQDAFMYGRLATIVHYLILEKGMEPVIVVGVDVVRANRTREYSLLGEQHQSFLKFFVEELISEVENEYLLRQEGIKRLLIGDSLAGAAALSLALNHKELFQHILCLSGAFFEDSVQLVKQAGELSWLSLWMLVGTEETAVKTEKGTFNFLKLNRSIKEVFLHLQANITYVEKEGGLHTWGFWQRELPEGLMHFLG